MLQNRFSNISYLDIPQEAHFNISILIRKKEEYLRKDADSKRYKIKMSEGSHIETKSRSAEVAKEKQNPFFAEVVIEKQIKMCRGS